MKLTEALKKSKVVRRASEPGVMYEKRNENLYVQGDPTNIAQEFGLDLIEANDWQFQIMQWVGSRAPKKESEK